MEEFFAGFLGYTALGLVALGIGLGLKKLISWGDVRGLPDADRRIELLGRLRELRGGGANHQECIAFLRREGLRAGTARGMLIDLEREQPADVEHTQAHTWNGYRFDYPGNWKVTSLFEEPNSPLGISVEGFGSSLVMFVQLLEERGYEDMVAEQRKQLREPSESRLERWGSLAGEGVVFTGPHKKLRLAVEIGVFRPRDSSIPMAIVQYHALEESELVGCGFELIQRTLARAA